MRSSAPTCRTIFIPSRLPAIVSPPGLRLPSLHSTHTRNSCMQLNGCGAGAKGSTARLLVQEVPHAGEHHGEAEAVGGGYDLGIADGAARLDHGSCAGLGRFFHAIGKGKKAAGATPAPVRENCGFHTAIFTESEPPNCPAPAPRLPPAFAKA